MDNALNNVVVMGGAYNRPQEVFMKSIRTYLVAVLAIGLAAMLSLTTAGCKHKGAPDSVGVSESFDFGSWSTEAQPDDGTTPPGDTVPPDETVPPDDDDSPLPYTTELKIIKRNNAEVELSDKPISLAVIVLAKFSRALTEDERNLFTSEFSLKDPDGNPVSGTFQWTAPAFDDVKFRLEKKLRHATKYDVHTVTADQSFTTMTKGDIDGDGFADLLIGESGHGISPDKTGQVLVLNGALLPTVGGTKILGENEGDRFGAAVAMAGDINGDGYEDFAIGAPGFDLAAILDVGKAYIWFGGTTVTPATEVVGDSFGEALGATIAGCDISGHGLSNVLIGAPSFGSQRGRVYLLKGGASPVVSMPIKEGPAVDHAFGSSIACLGKPDGSSDVIIGSPLFAAKKGMISLHRSEDLLEITALKGLNAGDCFGSSVAAMPDFTGDGRDDFIVGAPGYDLGTSFGIVHVFTTADTLDWTVNMHNKGAGETAGDRFGHSVLAIPDIGGDAAYDLLVGAPGASSNQGRIYSIKNVPGTLSVSGSPKRNGDAPGPTALGVSSSLTRDLNGDLKNDILVGEPGRESGKGGFLILNTANIMGPALVTEYGTDPGFLLGGSVAGP